MCPKHIYSTFANIKFYKSLDLRKIGKILRKKRGNALRKTFWICNLTLYIIFVFIILMIQINPF